MPIYEFYCPNNHRIYSFLARSLSLRDHTPRCPENPKFRMERMISNFAVTGRAKEKPDLPPGGDADDPRLAAAMAEMERDMAGMDTENPDPRQMAQMMRRMASLTGEKMPGEMEEMMRRLEAGEDPEKLEEMFGDEMGDMDSPDAPAAPGVESESGLKARLRALRRRPQRDPTLYEMADYIDLRNAV